MTEAVKDQSRRENAFSEELKLFLDLPIDHEKVFGTTTPTVDQWKTIRSLYATQLGEGTSEEEQ